MNFFVLKELIEETRRSENVKRTTIANVTSRRKCRQPDDEKSPVSFGKYGKESETLAINFSSSSILLLNV
uniref:Uncharacterized protein n=1 Tax=Romanomermis culicivorax TaxID=13658 RepID=A0A915K030_ROMCU